MSVLSQTFPPEPRLTEANLPDLSGKVFIITGAASGVGLELAKILYSRNGTVYVHARSSERAKVGINAVKDAFKQSRGVAYPIVFDLANLRTIKPAVQEFQTKEKRLDVLFLNAGVMTPPVGSKTVDGYDLELGTNCLGGFLLTRLLYPTLKATVSTPGTIPGSVRVVWVASIIHINTPKGGVRFDNAGNPVQLKDMDNYMQTKCGMLFLSREFVHRQGNDGVVHVCLHPGLMKTELQRYKAPIVGFLMDKLMKPAKYGAYTELYAGLSPDVKTARFYIPWGREGSVPGHLEASCKAQNGEKSISARFYDWCDRQVVNFL